MTANSTNAWLLHWRRRVRTDEKREAQCTVNAYAILNFSDKLK